MTDGPATRARLERARERLLATGACAAGAGIRPLVADSWQRSLRAGLDPERAVAPVDLVDDDLEQWRRSHPLAGVMPVVRRLLVDDAVDAGLLVAVSDAAGRLLWVEGAAQTRARMEAIHFVEGASWTESAAGTNAPGTALVLDRPVQILAGEHLARPVTPWSCAAAPVHDPDTGAVLGAVDLTGGDEVATPHALSAVRATVAAVERELQLQRLLRQQAGAARVRLRTLGVPAAVLESDRGRTRLSLRHSELLALLVDRPDGFTGDELAVALSDDDLAPVTLRAELSRLRSVLEGHGVGLAGRPYRLESPGALPGALYSDLAELRRRVAAGDLTGAVDLYRGDLLPTSDAPAVRRLRDRLRDELRAGLVAAGDPDLLLRYADTEHGRLDWLAWRAAYDALDPASPRWPRVRDHLALLEHELG